MLHFCYPLFCDCIIYMCLQLARVPSWVAKSWRLVSVNIWVTTRRTYQITLTKLIRWRSRLQYFVLSWKLSNIFFCSITKKIYCNGNGLFQSTAAWFVEQFEYAHSNMPQCNPSLQMFGCALAVPECNAEGTGPIPPCKDLCESKLLLSNTKRFWFLNYIFNTAFTCLLLVICNAIK